MEIDIEISWNILNDKNIKNLQYEFEEIEKFLDDHSFTFFIELRHIKPRRTYQFGGFFKNTNKSFWKFQFSI